MTKPTGLLLIVPWLAWSPLIRADADGHPPLRMPEVPQPAAPGIRITQLLVVERNGERLPLTVWSPCATDRGSLQIVATLESAPHTSFSEGTLIAVLTIDALVAPSNYVGGDLDKAERDLGWSTLQAIRTPGIRLVGPLAPSSRVSVSFPSAPLGRALAQFDSQDDGLRVLALGVRVQIAGRSLDRLVDQREVVRVRTCDTKRGRHRGVSGSIAPLR